MSATITDNRAEFNAALNAFVRVWTRKDGRSVKDALAVEGKKLSYEIAGQLKKIAPQPGGITSERLAAFKQNIGLRIHERKVSQVGMDQPMSLQSVVSGRLDGDPFRRGKNGKPVLARRGGKTRDQWRAQFAERERSLNPMNRGFRSQRAASRLAFQSMLADLELKYREKARGFLAFATRFKGRLDVPTFIKGTNRFSQSVNLAESKLIGDGEGHALTMTWGSGLSASSAGVGQALNKPQQSAIIEAAMRARTEGMMKYVQDRLAKDWQKA